MSRRLLTTRRHVPLDRADEYLAAWEQVRSAAENVGARAWIFRGAAHEDQFLEFIEWRGDTVTPHEEESVATARVRLDVFAAPGAVEEWEDAQ